MAVTLQQIADLAGVSRGTVDRALNNRGHIKSEVEEKIKRIAKELGYQPSFAGRALAMAKKNLKIGVILQSSNTPFMRAVLKGLETAKKEVESFGASVEIEIIDGINAGEVVNIMEKMREDNVSGIALSPSEDRYLMQTINRFSEEHNIPILTFNSDLEDSSRICFVGQDTKKSGQTAAGLMGEILDGKGKIMIVSGYEENLSLKNRTNSFIKEIELSYPKIDIVGVRYGYDDNWVAEKIAEEALKEYTDIKGFYITGSGVVGVCKAIKHVKKEKEIKVIANDLIEENIHWLLDGTINFLIGQDAYTQGYESVMLLFRKFFYDEEPKSKFRYTEIFIKTKYNI